MPKILIMPKTKWKLRSDRKENKGCPLIILADMDRKDLAAALDLLEIALVNAEGQTKQCIELFLQTFRK